MFNGREYLGEFRGTVGVKEGSGGGGGYRKGTGRVQ